VAEGEGGAHPTQMHKKKEKSGWKAPKKQQHYELRYNGGKRQMSGREKGGDGCVSGVRKEQLQLFIKSLYAFS